MATPSASTANRALSLVNRLLGVRTIAGAERRDARSAPLNQRLTIGNHGFQHFCREVAAAYQRD